MEQHRFSSPTGRGPRLRSGVVQVRILPEPLPAAPQAAGRWACRLTSVRRPVCTRGMRVRIPPRSTEKHAGFEWLLLASDFVWFVSSGRQSARLSTGRSRVRIPHEPPGEFFDKRIFSIVDAARSVERRFEEPETLVRSQASTFPRPPAGGRVAGFASVVQRQDAAMPRR
jgi:hypothetical protein